MFKLTSRVLLSPHQASHFDLQLKIQQGSRVDIRLPNVSSATLSGVDLTQQQGTSNHQQLPGMADDGAKSETELESGKNAAKVGQTVTPHLEQESSSRTSDEQSFSLTPRSSRPRL